MFLNILGYSELTEFSSTNILQNIAFDPVSADLFCKVYQTIRNQLGYLKKIFLVILFLIILILHFVYIHFVLTRYIRFTC